MYIELNRGEKNLITFISYHACIKCNKNSFLSAFSTKQHFKNKKNELFVQMAKKNVDNNNVFLSPL